MILDELQFISNEREREHAKLTAERDANIVNMGLHKYKLKRKVLSVMKEIDLDLEVLTKIRRAVLKVIVKLGFKAKIYYYVNEDMLVSYTIKKSF